jgi:hypothetical protein
MNSVLKGQAETSSLWRPPLWSVTHSSNNRSLAAHFSLQELVPSHLDFGEVQILGSWLKLFFTTHRFKCWLFNQSKLVVELSLQEAFKHSVRPWCTTIREIEKVHKCH